jgi:DNA polymerase II small subunit
LEFGYKLEELEKNKINRVVNLFFENGIAIQPEILSELISKSDDEITEIIEKVKNKISGEETILLTESLLREIKEEIKIPDFVEIKRPSDFNPVAKEYCHEFKIWENKDITGKSKCKGEIEDFVKYINDRFKRTKEIVISRPSNNRVVNLNFANSNNGKFRVIGIVNKKIETKNGHILIEIEDETGSSTLLALKNSEAFEKAKSLVTDEVLGFDIRTGKNFHIIEDLIFPDLSIREKKKSEKDVSVGFISDTHVGSRFFCNLEFENMIKFLNGIKLNEHEKKIAESIGYLIFAGDICDGIGVYPKQEKELIVKDIYEQYKIFSKLIELIPDYIHIFIAPGNHDAVRQTEPQPALKDFIKEKDNVHLISNPAYLTIENFVFLVYHGTSLDSIISSIPGLSYSKPENAIIQLLKKRNLAPIYDKNEIAPENYDYMFIEDDIDIFHTGHIHKNAFAEYRNRIIINSGTWQSQTDFQLKLGHIPTPCILPIYNLKEGWIEHLKF